MHASFAFIRPWKFYMIDWLFVLHHFSRSVCVLKFSKIELIISAPDADTFFSAKNNIGNQRSFFVGVHFFTTGHKSFIQHGMFTGL